MSKVGAGSEEDVLGGLGPSTSLSSSFSAEIPCGRSARGTLFPWKFLETENRQHYFISNGNSRISDGWQGGLLPAPRAWGLFSCNHREIHTLTQTSEGKKRGGNIVRPREWNGHHLPCAETILGAGVGSFCLGGTHDEILQKPGRPLPCPYLPTYLPTLLMGN